MTFSPRSSGLLRLAFILAVACLWPATAKAQAEWRPVSPEELALKQPSVEKDADAEAIFWETRLDDKKSSQLAISHYVRVKIFTERGRERFSKLDIPYAKGKKVEEIAARVIRPDGSIKELSPKDIFEREIAKVGKLKVMAKSFAVPAIEPGVIVEYQYTEKIKGDSVGGEKLIFQRDIPMGQMTYFIRSYEDHLIKINWYNVDGGEFVKQPDGFYKFTMFNVPAYKDEPYVPPDDEVRWWGYINTSRNVSYTLLYNKWIAIMDRVTVPGKQIRQKSLEIIRDSNTDTEKLEKLYSFVQKNIKNTDFETSALEQQNERPRLEDVGHTLQQQAGSSISINLLFASLASAAGFETGVVLAGDRSETFFAREKYPFSSFVEPIAIAVEIAGEELYLDPGTPYLGFGELDWKYEGVKATILHNMRSITKHKRSLKWENTPLSTPQESSARRSGNFRLQSDNSLEGRAVFEYHGHQAISRRRDEYRSSDARREEIFKEELKSRFSMIEIKNLLIENFEDPSKPLRYTFDVKIPSYARKAGRRLIFQPGVFEYGSQPIFTSELRINDIYIPFGWSESDEIKIELPAGYELENADSPAAVSDVGGVGDLRISMSINRSGSTLTYKRNFLLGGDGYLLVPASSYTELKHLFDSFQHADAHMLSLINNEGDELKQ